VQIKHYTTRTSRRYLGYNWSNSYPAYNGTSCDNRNVTRYDVLTSPELLNDYIEFHLDYRLLRSDFLFEYSLLRGWGGHIFEYSLLRGWIYLWTQSPERLEKISFWIQLYIQRYKARKIQNHRALNLFLLLFWYSFYLHLFSTALTTPSNLGGCVTDYGTLLNHHCFICVLPTYRLRITYVSRCFAYVFVSPFIYFHTFLVYIWTL